MNIYNLRELIEQELELTEKTIKFLDKNTVDTFSFSVGYRNALRLLKYELAEPKKIV